MTENELPVGEPRLGWLHLNGATETGEIAAMLLNTGTSIKLTLPLDSGLHPRFAYARWWDFGIKHMDDPGREKFSYEPPRVMVFQDAFGAISLVGCRATGFRSSLAAGHGDIVPNYAVLGGRSFGYEAVNGMRTEVPALAKWTRYSAMAFASETNEHNRIQAYEMRLSSPAPLQLSPRLNLELNVHWKTDRKLGHFTAQEAVQVQTCVGLPRTWEQHLDLHGAMLELVSISGAQAFGIANVEVLLNSDSPRSFESNTSAKWRKVVHHRFPTQDKGVEDARFLYPYSEVGSRGVKRWLRLRKDYSRAVDALLNIIRSDDLWGVSNVVQSGVALEALGHAIETQKNGGARLKRNQLQFNTALRVILEDMVTVPIDDPEEWIRRANVTYMGAKHADRGEMPDTLDMMNSLRENLHMLRFWIGLQLGVKPATLEANFRRDPLRLPLIRSE